MKKIKNLALSLGLSVPLVLGGCADNNKKVDSYVDSVSENVSQVLTPENEAVYNKTFEISRKPIDMEYVVKNKIKRNITSIGENEFIFFTDYFNLSSDKEILEKIKSIQAENGLKQDEILGNETLGVLYLKYYSRIDKSQLPFDILKRFEIYEEMRDYRNYPKRGTQYGTVKPMSVPSVFEKDFYYGDSVGVNIPGTYINQELYSKVENTINKPGVISKIINIDGKYVLATYVNQELKLLSYTSPGSPEVKGGIKTQLGRFNTTVDNMYHISSAKESVKITKNGAIGPVMPYALHIVNGVYSHMGYVDGDRQSHGCVRLPFLYAKGLYEIYKDTGSMSREITAN